MKREKIYMYGKHALVEALTNAPRVIQKVFLAAHLLNSDLAQKVSELDIPLSTLKTKELMSVSKDTSHQGVIAIIDSSLLLCDFNHFFSSFKITPETSFIFLDGLHDPQNVGAIIRSAAAFGISGILLPEGKQASITGTVIKTSAGMVFSLPIISLGDGKNALEFLKEKGFQIQGLLMNGSTPLNEECFKKPTVFVVGNESSGISSTILTLCDSTLQIPMHNKTESLNAAVASAIAFYAWNQKHPLNII